MSKTLLLAITIVAAALATAVPASGAEATCAPASDNTVTPVATPNGTIYVKTSTMQGPRGLAVPVPTQAWEESNGHPGLQKSSEEACGAPADRDRADLTFAF